MVTFGQYQPSGLGRGRCPRSCFIPGAQELAAALGAPRARREFAPPWRPMPCAVARPLSRRADDASLHAPSARTGSSSYPCGIEPTEKLPLSSSSVIARAAKPLCGSRFRLRRSIVRGSRFGIRSLPTRRDSATASLPLPRKSAGASRLDRRRAGWRSARFPSPIPQSRDRPVSGASHRQPLLYTRWNERSQRDEWRSACLGMVRDPGPESR